jgi:hypothetical protein
MIYIILAVVAVVLVLLIIAMMAKRKRKEKEDGKAGGISPDCTFLSRYSAGVETSRVYPFPSLPHSHREPLVTVSKKFTLPMESCEAHETLDTHGKPADNGYATPGDNNAWADYVSQTSCVVLCGVLVWWV